jgi:hypothetical protein
MCEFVSSSCGVLRLLPVLSAYHLSRVALVRSGGLVETEGSSPSRRVGARDEGRGAQHLTMAVQGRHCE